MWWKRRWARWGAVALVLLILIGVGTKAAIGAVQDPYLVQYTDDTGPVHRYALVIVPRNPSSQEIERIILQFAKKYKDRPLLAEFYTDGNAAITFEGGGAPDDSATAAEHVGEFSRPASGSGQGWADAKGSKDSHRLTFSAP
ncbi:MAG: hypothetical protein M1118_09040 [Chloroflexi bacterium]|nr:hypothetical protein [Chloroflexota bacterium]